MSASSPKKPKLVRDSFTIPKTEYAAIDTLKSRAIGLGTSVKKSELLRAGLMLLQALNDVGFKSALSAVPTLKTGRPLGEAKPVKSKDQPAKGQAPKAAPVVRKAAKAAAPARKAAAPAQATKPATRRATSKAAVKPVVKPAVKAAPAKVGAKPAEVAPAA